MYVHTSALQVEYGQYSWHIVHDDSIQCEIGSSAISRIRPCLDSHAVFCTSDCLIPHNESGYFVIRGLAKATYAKPDVGSVLSLVCFVNFVKVLLFHLGVISLF